jgi:hypothetical protein
MPGTTLVDRCAADAATANTTAADDDERPG